MSDIIILWVNPILREQRKQPVQVSQHVSGSQVRQRRLLPLDPTNFGKLRFIPRADGLERYQLGAQAVGGVQLGPVPQILPKAHTRPVHH
jgi:hypothetical protein